LTDISEVLTASIIRAMLIARHNISEDNSLHTRRRENLKSHRLTSSNTELLFRRLLSRLFDVENYISVFATQTSDTAVELIACSIFSVVWSAFEGRLNSAALPFTLNNTV
jgi:hypothetical protein